MEKLFSRFWKTAPERLRASPGHVSIDDFRVRLETFAGICNPDLGNVTIGGSLWGAGFVGPELLLPRDAAWSQDSELNLRLLQGLVLRASATRQIRLTFKHHDRSRIEPRLVVLASMPAINRWLDARFPGYRGWETEVLSSMESVWRSRDQGLRQIWRELVSERSDREAARKVTRLIEIRKSMKRNDEPPDFLHATVPLPFRSQSGVSGAELEDNPSDGRSEILTERRRQQKENVESSDIDGPENPIIHSFEKTEALDDYDGGHRAASGDDDLSSHEAALEELELNRLTRSGRSSSVYRQDAVAAGRPGLNASESHLPAAVTYPEWSSRESRYWREHCVVFPDVAPYSGDGPEVRARFLASHSYLVAAWRARLARQMNVPIWLRRQAEGTDLDLDNLVRLKSEARSSSDRPLVYTRKRKAERDLCLTFLVDSSYSTDSYVAGKRIADTFREAIGLCGLLLDGLVDRVMVASATSSTRRRVDFLSLKSFSDGWDQFFARFECIRPDQYTRLGPAIRHATSIMLRERAVHPLLILLTDGKPTDLDRYEGSHGESDVRMAVLEAETKGIRVLALTVSDQDPSRLRSMFGRQRPIDQPIGAFEAILELLKEAGFRR